MTVDLITSSPPLARELPCTPRIAILMATYAGDEPAHLKAALKSLSLQRYPREMMCIYLAVDGPIPNTNARLIESARRAKGAVAMRIVPLAVNSGLAEALNAAAKQLGDEEFVFRADADDLSEPTRIEEQVRYMKAHPEVDILGTSIVEFSESDHILGQRTYPRAHQVRAYISYASPLAHPSVCFRRSAWERLGGYRPIPFNEDLDMWFRAADAGMCIDNLSQPLVRFRISPGFYRRRSWSKAFAEFRCYERGIFALHGLDWRLALPPVRLLARLMPPAFTKFLYGRSALRRKVLNRGSA